MWTFPLDSGLNSYTVRPLYFYLLVIISRVMFLAETGSHSVAWAGPVLSIAQASLKLVMLIVLSPKCWVTDVQHHACLPCLF